MPTNTSELEKKAIDTIRFLAVDAVENAAKMLGLSHRRITSGAGHDACNLNTVIPAAMVFVPCKDGISHNELEDATQADCAAGANVLMHTVLALAGVAS